ncbi:uncharacterized protein BDV17DRAFT_254304 [Aspergillus undulatus]|uniref:uncharacterized protein n=1 Tax=Aspergillus undulatus TaxID=1810928 RepID=UPI003CCDCC7D
MAAVLPWVSSGRPCLGVPGSETKCNGPPCFMIYIRVIRLQNLLKMMLGIDCRILGLLLDPRRDNVNVNYWQ